MEQIIATSKNSPRPPQGGEGAGEGGEIVAFIGLGSNLGDRQENIASAVNRISGIPGISVLALSTLVETKPIGPVQNQPDFLNGIAAVATTLSPLDLLDQLLSIEMGLGRIRRERWGPRIIDLDIILYGVQKIRHPRLIVPHPEMKNRDFIQAAIEELQQRGIVPLSPTLSPKGARGVQ